MFSITQNKPVRLFIVLGGFFIANALIAELVGVKIFSLEKSLGMDAFDISLFGENNLSFLLTAGVIVWPVVFIMTDVINEYFGLKGVRFLSFLTVGLIIYTFIIITGAIIAVPADFWIGTGGNVGISDMNIAFNKVFGQGRWIIFGSIVAFLIGQLLDVLVFQYIKRITGNKKVWLRATGSTLFSQLIDSYIVLYIAFYIGADWSIGKILAIGTMNYIYKFFMAIALTPVIYGVHFIIDKYLGEELAGKLKSLAIEK